MVVYAGAAVSFLGALMQISAIKYVAASDVAMVFAFSPVVTAMLAEVFMREILGPLCLGGAVLILVACIATAINGERERRKPS